MNAKSNRRVLIIDDNHAIHQDFRKILGPAAAGAAELDGMEASLFDGPGRRVRRENYEMDFAFQGQEGVKSVQKAMAAGRPYALVFVDVRMPPGWDGIETTARIWEQDPDIQVVICTAYSDYAWDEIMAKIGKSDQLVILKKPFDSIEVLQLAQALTHKWVLSTQLKQKMSDLEKQVEERRTDLSSAIAIKNLILENSILGIALVRNRNFMWANRKLGELLGMPLEQIQGASTRVIYPSTEIFDSFGREIYQALAKTGFSDSVLQLKRNNGSLFWCRFIGKALNPADDYADSIWMFEDISERKAAEEKIRLQTSALEAADNGMLISDSTGKILWVNPAFEQLTGYRAAEVLGKTTSLLKSGHHDPQFYKEIWSTVLGGRVWHGELVNRRKNGSLYHEEMTITPLRDEAGAIQNFVAVKQDISRRKNFEMEQRMMEIQLRQAQKLEGIGRLAAGIAHEINTPMQYVGDNTRFLKDSYETINGVLRSHGELLKALKENSLTPELTDRAEKQLADSDLDFLNTQIPAAIQETLEGVERVSNIVRAMKEFSHPGSKERTAADLNKAIESTVTVARNEWKYVAEAKMELDRDLPLVPCFVGEFNQCILNLIVNAAHAIGDVLKNNPGAAKGLITVQTHRDGDFAEIRVSDTGTGIPESVRPRIFEPFFTTKGVGKGTGQGLSIVYNSIVKQHGGTVSFETQFGKGTTFILRLPLMPPQSRDRVPRHSEATAGEGAPQSPQPSPDRLSAPAPTKGDQEATHSKAESRSIS